MLTHRIIPCLDIRDGRVVKGVRFQNLKDAGDPVEAAAAYACAGADELVVLDVSATPDGRKTAADTVAAIRKVLDIPLTVGGGVRSIANAQRLLSAGADKVGVNSAAVARPELLSELALAFGRQCTVLSVDAARDSDGGWDVVVRSGTSRVGRDAIQWAQEGVGLGAGEILLTSWDQDGTRQGYDLELISAMANAIRVPIIASGGANGAQHMAQALEAGASAVLAASIFHEKSTTIPKVKTELIGQGLEIRPC